MNTDFEHFLITRFNLGFKTRYPDPDVRKKWMENRIKAFEKLTLPSVLAQSNKNFRWLVLFDPSVTEEHPEFIKRLEAIDFCQPVYIQTDSFAVGDLAATMKTMINPEIKHVITTRLDSDDAISQNYIDEIQKHFVPHQTYIVNFTDGLGYSDKGDVSIFIRNLVAFASFYECIENDELKTIYFTSHTSLKKYAPVTHVSGNYMYIYYHHDDNISNNILKMTSFFKLPLDYIARFLCHRFDFFNKHLRYSYRIPISKTDPRLDLFNTKLKEQ